MSDGGQIRSFIERVQRLQEEKRSIEDDIKEVYAEAKANGYDTKVLRAVVKHLNRDQSEVAEFDAIFDLYLDAYENPKAAQPETPMPAPSRAHVARDAGARVKATVAAVIQKDHPPGGMPEAQDEGTDCESQDSGSAERSAGDGGSGSEHADQFVASRGAGEGFISSVDPAPAADDIGPPIRGLAEANAIASRAVQPAAPQPKRSDPDDLAIPAFLRRTAPGSHPSFGSAGQ